MGNAICCNKKVFIKFTHQNLDNEDEEIDESHKNDYITNNLSVAISGILRTKENFNTMGIPEKYISNYERNAQFTFVISIRNNRTKI